MKCCGKACKANAREKRLEGLLFAAKEYVLWVSAGGSKEAHELLLRIEEGLEHRPEDVVPAK